MPLRSDPEKIRKWQQDGARRWRENRRRNAKAQRGWLQRVLVAARDAGYRCQAEGMHADSCGGLGLLLQYQGHAHHVHPRSWGGTDESSAVIWLHPDCHARIHSRPAEAAEHGYLTRGRDGDG